MNNKVADHYGRPDLLEAVWRWLHQRGVVQPKREDISPLDEFHVRGAEVSLELARDGGFSEGTAVLDVGCGIGGPARMLSAKYGCHVTGIDITREYVETARELSALVGLDHLNNFIEADALSMPFADRSFDVVWTQHVQMNIEDKTRLYGEITRVLKTGARFIYYDIFATGQGPITYPVPWADNRSISFLMTTSSLDTLLASAGLRRLQTKHQTEAALVFLENITKKMVAGDFLPPLAILLRDQAEARFGNLYQNVRQGLLELQSGIYVKVA